MMIGVHESGMIQHRSDDTVGRNTTGRTNRLHVAAYGISKEICNGVNTSVHYENSTCLAARSAVPRLRESH